MSDQKQLLRDRGVYRLDHEGEAPEFFVALYNDDEGDYEYALARALPIPGAGFAYDDSEFLIFVEKESEEEPRRKIFTVNHDAEGRRDGRLVSDLQDTGLVAVSAREAGITPED